MLLNKKIKLLEGQLKNISNILINNNLNNKNLDNNLINNNNFNISLKNPMNSYNYHRNLVTKKKMKSRWKW